MWVKWFIIFHRKRHPADMSEPEINVFLTHLAVKEKVSASTQTQALSAILFLYRHVIGREVSDLGDLILPSHRAPRHPKPTFLSEYPSASHVMVVGSNPGQDSILIIQVLKAGKRYQ